MATSRTGTAQWKRLRRKLLRPGVHCWLCGGPIDVTLHHLDPMAPTLDHVIPYAKGGTDDEHNLRPSHRHCNRAKSDRLDLDPTPTARPVVRFDTGRACSHHGYDNRLQPCDCGGHHRQW